MKLVGLLLSHPLNSSKAENTAPRKTCQEIGFKGFLVTCGFGDDVDTLARCSEKRLRELWSLLGITCRCGAT